MGQMGDKILLYPSVRFPQDKLFMKGGRTQVYKTIILEKR
jgi:hypothetical protein